MKKELWLVVCGFVPPVGTHAIRPGLQVIGRAKDCDIRVPDSSVSRRHAELLYEDGTLTVRDLGSRNGTFVNGKQVTSAQLAVGSVLGVGHISLDVRDEIAPWSEEDQELDTPILPRPNGRDNGRKRPE